MNNTKFQPIQPLVVVVHVFQTHGDVVKCLLLRRVGYLNGLWQMVTGKVQMGENTVESAKRELLEETGLIADRFYVADFVDTYFDPRHNAIFMAPVFVAFIDSPQRVKISPEHDDYKWLSIEEAFNQLELYGQINGLKHIVERFINKEPLQHFVLP